MTHLMDSLGPPHHAVIWPPLTETAKPGCWTLQRRRVEGRSIPSHQFSPRLPIFVIQRNYLFQGQSTPLLIHLTAHLSLPPSTFPPPGSCSPPHHPDLRGWKKLEQDEQQASGEGILVTSEVCKTWRLPVGLTWPPLRWA